MVVVVSDGNSQVYVVCKFHELWSYGLSKVEGWWDVADELSCHCELLCLSG